MRDLVARADLGIHAGLLTLVVGKQLSRTIKLTPLKCVTPLFRVFFFFFLISY